MLTQLSDETLLKRVGQQDRHAMEVLYKRHCARLTNFVLSTCKDPAAASDVVQETMLAVWRQASGFQGKSSAKTWIYGIARFKAVDRLRANARLSPSDDIPEQVDDRPGPEAQAVLAGDVQQLRICLGELDDKRRRVVRLAFFEDMTYEEISQVEGIKAGTVKSRVFHAKQALMRCLSRALGKS
ncbi:MAG: RNA polymerase sigma factor [Mangrovicoccus sp.]